MAGKFHKVVHHEAGKRRGQASCTLPTMIIKRAVTKHVMCEAGSPSQRDNGPANGKCGTSGGVSQSRRFGMGLCVAHRAACLQMVGSWHDEVTVYFDEPEKQTKIWSIERQLDTACVLHGLNARCVRHVADRRIRAWLCTWTLT